MRLKLKTKNLKLKIAVYMALILVVALAMGAALDTVRYGWSKPRAACDANDTLVTASYSTMKFANIPTHTYKPNTAQNGIEVAWVMDANEISCKAYLFAAREQGDIVLVWYGTLTSGEQISTSGEYYVDTIASTTDNWIKFIKEIDGSNSNRMARIVLDTCGYAYFFFQYTDLNSETVRAYFSGY